MDIQIRKGTLSDVDGYIRLLHDVKNAMESVEWFYVDPDEKTWELARNGSLKFWLAEENDRIAGAFSIIDPGMDAFNLGRDLDLEDALLEKVIHMDTAAVHPDYRGLGLQRRLMQTAERELAGHILLCTVHPDNRYSLQNVLKQGYTIEKRMEKYGSVRYILRKDLL